MATAPEDLLNQALVDIGFPGRINSINEGSRASIAGLEIYSETRDELLDDGDWPLARRANIALTLLKGPPPAGGFNPLTPWTAQYPPPGWLYEYLYPADMIKLSAIVPPPGLMFDLDPKAGSFRVDDDNSLVDNAGLVTVEKKVILTNVKGALAVYIGQVTDPSLFEPGFIAVFVKRLGEKLSRVLMSGESVQHAERAESVALTAAGLSGRG